MRSPGEKFWLIAWWLFAGGLCAGTYLLAPISDPDFFWHLKTGQWLWEHKALPATDPFAFLPATGLDPRQSFLLTSYWLTQVLYSGAHALGGWSGIFLLRYLLIGGLVAVLWLRKGAGTFACAILLWTAIVALLSEYPVERPQYFSFLLFAMLLAVLNRADKAGTSRELSVYLGLACGVAFLWGNMHGGFLVGQIVCLFYVLNILYLKFIVKEEDNFFGRKIFFGLLAIGLSFLNPNIHNIGYVYKSLLWSGDDYTKHFISEYLSFPELLKSGKYIFIVFPLLAVFAVAANVRRVFLKNIPVIVLTFCFLFVAWKQMRYFPFLVILVLPAAADFLDGFGKKIAIFATILLFGTIVCLADVRYESGNYARLKNFGPVDRSYPAAAVDFMARNNIRGKILNDYGWGGYLQWALPADRKLFIDGRTLDLTICKDWIFLSSGVNVGALLDKYRFDVALLPRMLNGQPVLLTELLLRDSAWQPVFSEGNAVVLLKRLPGPPD